MSENVVTAEMGRGPNYLSTAKKRCHRIYQKRRRRACDYATNRQDEELAALENTFGQAKQMWDLCSALMEVFHVSLLREKTFQR